jgi:hypothetical protein
MVATLTLAAHPGSSAQDDQAEGGQGPRGIEKIVAEFDEGADVLRPRLNAHFGVYDLYKTGHCIHTLWSHCQGLMVRGYNKAYRARLREKGNHRLHGIEVLSKPTDGSGESRAQQVRIRRISVCYKDGGWLTASLRRRESFSPKIRWTGEPEC